MKKVIVAPNAPAAIGPYCHGIKCGDTIYTSGQIALIPETGKLAEGVQAQANQVLNNLLAIVEAGGGKKENIVKMEIFITDMADFGEINEVYAEFFGENKPARFLFQVAALPAGAIIEAAATAYLG
jgi:2-iminobutanoate/2-iminopropanoate deaminase